MFLQTFPKIPRWIAQVAAGIPDSPHDHRPHIRNDVVRVEIGKGHVLLDVELLKTLWNVEPFGFDQLDGVIDGPGGDAKPEWPAAIAGYDPETG